MGRDRGPKHKLSRREGKDLFGTGGASLERRLNQPPGMHGGKMRRRLSEYGRQLREKQKVKRMYGMREGQFRRFFAMAQHARGLTGEELLKLLERRLDNVVYRLGFARSRPQARQLVNHRHVWVDGQRVDIPSYLVEPGQVIELKESAREIPDIQELLENPPLVPGWLERQDGTGRVVREPNREEIDQDINEQLIVEFYSR
ncbi:MAG TPA: 30S ribosomal protein S4 [Chloroflexi bacterium]|nr:30S ribosomal protein S4 [Chloroflexota bacterium]